MQFNLVSFRYTGTRAYDGGSGWPEGVSAPAHDAAERALKQSRRRLAQLQERLYAENREAVLIIFQAMDAAGKDGVVKHVFSGMNPQGIDVYNFKQPSAEELDHDYLWRCVKRLPERGKLCVFNRSYYEEVLVGRVHELYRAQNLPERCLYPDLIARRCRQICGLEQYLWENGIRVVKFYLTVSRAEQKRRFLKRIEQPEKNWKFSDSDIRERAYWADYQAAYRDAINATAAPHAPWYVIPADDKAAARMLVAQVLAGTLTAMDPRFPALPPERVQLLDRCRRQLLEEEPE